MTEKEMHESTGCFRYPHSGPCCVAARRPPIMSDATNDTTRTTPDVWAAKIALGLARGNTAVLTKQDVSDILRVVESLEADLERLAGPVCDHPPCKGARAIEHAHHGSSLVDRSHPPSPSVEAWLRARSAK